MFAEDLKVDRDVAHLRRLNAIIVEMVHERHV